MPIGDAILGAIRAAQATVGDTVTIRRGDDSTADVPVVPCATRTILEISDDRETEVEVCDFLIAVGDYQIAAAEVLPERGDEIVREVGGKVVTFEVLPISDAAEFWYSDPFRKTLRVRTKKSAEVAA